MKFLNKIIDALLAESKDLSHYHMVLPGKRPVVFIRDILKNNKQYSGFLPQFSTIEDLITSIAQKQELKGIALWLFSYQVYQRLFPAEDFSQFLKWFPTLLKDWDDILKFTDDDTAVLDYMFDEERIKNWGVQFGDEDNARNRHLDFWRKMKDFLPVLKKELEQQGFATSGMLHQEAKHHLESYIQNTDATLVFCGFNALTPIEERLVKTALSMDKALCFFQSDTYYMEDDRQEAGQFLRQYKQWEVFNDYRPFRWIEDDFSKPKQIKTYEVSGNVTQTHLLTKLLDGFTSEDYSKTAIVLLDENLLPTTLDALSAVPQLNITMGLPIKNLSFSIAMKQVFYLQNQLFKKPKASYYYKDVITILESLPATAEEEEIIKTFKQHITEHNVVYLSATLLKDYLGALVYYPLLQPQSAKDLLDLLIDYCYQLKFREINDILFETIAYFEKNFRIVKNQISPYDFEIKIENLEVLIQQMLNSENIDFEGEPLAGLQVMGLLETRLLNFDTIILLSTNEGKLPLGNSQNTYLPFDVRAQFGLNTFIENDGIYAYHFYRLLQDSQQVHLLYNGLSTGVNTGEKSRFIEQLKIESPHEIQQIVIENPSEPIEQNPMQFKKSEQVLQKLRDWTKGVAASHLMTYLYNPVDFYMKIVLGVKEMDAIEEELSERNYGNLVHYALQHLYEQLKGKVLLVNDLEKAIASIDESIEFAIKTLKHQPEFYQRGMNFVHKAMAKKVIEEVLNLDLALVKSGNTLEIVELEKKIEGVPFKIDDEQTVYFKGFIDRIDRLNGVLRVIDYKTAKTKKLQVKITDKNRETLFMNSEYKQALQLCMYQYALSQNGYFPNQTMECGIWSFAEVSRGVQSLSLNSELSEAMISIATIIKEILNPEIDFIEPA